MKDRIYGVLRRAGAFYLMRRLFRHKLMILCYHGISLDDEHEWWPGVFVTEDRFRGRLKLLKDHGYRVLGLEDALNRLSEGSLPANSIVITADDGYLNSPETLVECCQEFGYPLTIYVTSYYAEKQTPIFNVMVQYLFWKTDRSSLKGDLSAIGLPGVDHIDLGDSVEKQRWCERIINYGRENCDEDGRQNILKALCAKLELNYGGMVTAGMFRLMGQKQLQRIADKGVDVQLHTHRHVFPVDKDQANREISENREFLEPIAGKSLEHFCYPSGKWDPAQLPWLNKMNIRSATTCNLGFVSEGDDYLTLRRYLDKQTISDNEFLAEISGFLAFARQIRGKVRSIWN